MLRPRIARPVSVVVAQIPRLTRTDQLTTTSAPHHSGRHEPGEQPPAGLMRAPYPRWLVDGRTLNLTADSAQSRTISGDQAHRGEKSDCAAPAGARPKKRDSVCLFVASENDVWRDRLVTRLAT
jgi:hypothetical protein